MRPFTSSLALAPAFLMGLALTAWMPAPASAFSSGVGVGGGGCADCHAPEADTGVAVSISGPATLSPNQTANYTIAITPPSLQIGGAFSVIATNGTLGLVDPRTTTAGTAVTHSAAHAGVWQYDFSVTAPASVGMVISLASTGMAFDNPVGNGSEDLWNNTGGSFSIDVVPEPGSAALMGLGLGLLAVVGRRRRD